MFLFSPLLFQPCSIGLCRFFLSDILGFCMFAKKCKKHGGNKKNNTSPMFQWVLQFCFVCFLFSQPFFFLFFLHGCQEEPNTAKIPKDQIIQNSYGSYIFLRSCKSEKFLADANNGVLRAHSAIVQPHAADYSG